eukprot:CAMPEP_0198138822 /NCGR_PEP_ID=MMETSP1443-20131203/2213_1 /TAXON_ID=186043 /ORGANISM="Entomoneis sp., Strain CCMP2396" /LENGTH=257 /DNA_ID=CAMNT_0043800761 /DNA_START=122 /DNA_END=895 /DNA_ORIENTATION=-
MMISKNQTSCEPQMTEQASAYDCSDSSECSLSGEDYSSTDNEEEDVEETDSESSDPEMLPPLPSITISKMSSHGASQSRRNFSSSFSSNSESYSLLDGSMGDFSLDAEAPSNGGQQRRLSRTRSDIESLRDLLNMQDSARSLMSSSCSTAVADPLEGSSHHQRSDQRRPILLKSHPPGRLSQTMSNQRSFHDLCHISQETVSPQLSQSCSNDLDAASSHSCLRTPYLPHESFRRRESLRDTLGAASEMSAENGHQEN